MVLGGLAVLASIVALAVLDRQSGRRTRRDWRAWRQVGTATWLADAGVVSTLLVWHVIGATSSDDGYNLTIARVAPQAGYVANYYRYFGTTEAPFDWYLSVLAATGLGEHRRACGCGYRPRWPASPCWLIISHWGLRRLGPGRGGLGTNTVAVLTGGVVFVAAWLPFNNGLRPEPLIALGVIVTWMLVERAIALQRLAPAAVAIVVAMLTATLAPQGLIAVAALLTGARAIASIIRRRRRDRRVTRAAGRTGGVAVADPGGGVPQPDAGDGRRVGPHQIQGRPDDRVVPGLAALLLPHRGVQPRRVDGAAVRGAGAAAVPVRHAGGAAAPRPGAGACQRPGLAADRHHRVRPAAADVHADEVGRAVRRVRQSGRRTRARSPRSPSPASVYTTAAT